MTIEQQADLDYEGMEDLDLVEACRQDGDEGAFGALKQRYHRRLRRFISRKVGGTAEVDEILQEAFLRIYRNLDSFRGGASFSPWAFRITRNLCIDVLRKPDRRMFVPLDETDRDDKPPSHQHRAESPDPQADDQLYGSEVGEAIQEALEGLPKRHREVFMMYQFDHMSYDEIAVAVGIPVGTVKSRMHGALVQLREDLLYLFPEGIHALQDAPDLDNLDPA